MTLHARCDDEPGRHPAGAGDNIRLARIDNLLTLLDRYGLLYTRLGVSSRMRVSTWMISVNMQ